ncbi:MAG: hypothetical protein O4803_13895 [Trichodesmium sp. St15_bin1_1]|nr:hypothetical protein [Trichodesmium sp. St18_bin1]MDE5089176.1 hypothetical protein [Trichodesmium sp. St16_bin2-tuft]MDE5108939.1 hypothetical protein [Trichodesmium sp. St17_bin3_1_1]MDE5115270.1 hypothetical protein [Trichodesmium sp. St15_bin1_1]MDE5118010.1 hypothetical protein [Trichodesmium sp. St2_bin2_1]MDE5119048.1 hypothetical protein [Trichodesmium sp. St19_bin1]
MLACQGLGNLWEWGRPGSFSRGCSALATVRDRSKMENRNR